jgi:sulfotransferase
VTYQLQGVTDDHIEKMTRPRLFKTHYPVQFLPHQVWTVKPKLIYIYRDIKDAACSLYHYRMDLNHEKFTSIEESFDDILEDKIWYGPYREHLLNWKSLPDYENVIYLTYEEVIADMGATIRKLAKFLNKPVTDEQIEKAKDHLSFAKMKSKKIE